MRVEPLHWAEAEALGYKAKVWPKADNRFLEGDGFPEDPLQHLDKEEH